MWLKKTDLHKSLRKNIEDILSSEKKNGYFPTSELETNLRQYPVADPFVAVLDERVEEKLFDKKKGKDFNRWIEDINSWLASVQDPRNEPTTQDSILYIFWDRFSTDLADSLRAGRIVAAIPTEGYVLAFVGALQKCIVIHYQFFGFIPKLEAKIVIDKPKSVFDWWEAIDVVGHASRNYLKNVLTSGHKLIYHRGVLVHVDRRDEAKVFGPSIDTLVMAEELSRSIYEQSVNWYNKIDVALEIGTGSGFLTAGIVKNLPSLKKLICIDIESSAISCTEKNINIACFAPGSHKPKVSLNIGAFDPAMFEPKADLIVCNPPYIPYLPNGKKRTGFEAPYLGAVGGLDLIEQILTSLPKLLSEKGKLLLMVSHISIQETEILINRLNLKVEKPLGEAGYEVLFDVEAVLEDDDWRKFLIDREYPILFRGGVYYHRLQPLWISLSNEE